MQHDAGDGRRGHAMLREDKLEGRLEDRLDTFTELARYLIQIISNWTCASSNNL